MPHWIVKSEPTVYSFDQLVAEGRTAWTGVRSAEARNNLAAMRVGDRLLYYHSQVDKAVVGVATVARAAYPDPTSPDDDRWVVVDVAPLARLARPVTLAQFKADALLAESKLVKQGRLSVTPLSEAQHARVIELGGGERPL